MKTPSFVVGDRVSNRRSIAEDPKLYGVVEDVDGRFLVRWDRDNVRAIKTHLQRTTWEDDTDLILESRGDEEHMRTFTQEEKDWILQELAKTDHDNYIVGALVREANQVTTKKSKEEQMIKIIYSALLSSNHSDVKNFRNDVLGYVPENGYLDIVVDHGTFRITVEKSFR